MKTIEGDLIKLAQEGHFDVIVHGCNCWHMMGGGIAKTISTIYPEVFKADVEYGEAGDDKLGEISTVKTSDGFIVVNGYTQYSISSGAREVDYDAVASVFENVKEKYSGLRIGYPMIGAGLARGNWNIIKTIIDETLKGEDHTFVKYKPS